jgi:hypothetical protein
MICPNCNLETGTKAKAHKTASFCVQALLGETTNLKKQLNRKGRARPKSGRGVEFGAPKAAKKAVRGRPPATELDVARDGAGHIEALLGMLEAGPVRDGEAHPAEAYMVELIEQYYENSFLWFIDIFIMNSYIKPAAVANLMQLIRRLLEVPLKSKEEEQSISWAVGLASVGVYHPDVRIQASCIEALEYWATGECVEKLQEYLETYDQLDQAPSANFLAHVERVITKIRSTRQTRMEGRNKRRN